MKVRILQILLVLFFFLELCYCIEMLTASLLALINKVKFHVFCWKFCMIKSMLPWLSSTIHLIETQFICKTSTVISFIFRHEHEISWFPEKVHFQGHLNSWNLNFCEHVCYFYVIIFIDSNIRCLVDPWNPEKLVPDKYNDSTVHVLTSCPE